MKRTSMIWQATLGVAVLTLTAMVATPAAQKKDNGKNGTTLAASKTLDICSVDDATVRYSGEISVWNEGVLDTQGLKIVDTLQNNVGDGRGFVDAVDCDLSFDPPIGEIPAGTSLPTATVYKYSCEASLLPGDIRNSAVVTIMNHSGSFGTAKGPNPKATFTGTIAPCEKGDTGGCAYSQGYFKNHAWPGDFDREALFFSSGLTWEQVLNMEPQGNGYFILAHQYIAAALNQASGASLPDGIFSATGTFTLANAWFTLADEPDVACQKNSSCGLQKTWGEELNTYNLGMYPGGPTHCGK